MRQYFEKMRDFGKPLTDKQIEKAEENRKEIEKVMEVVEAEINRVKNAGIPAEKINQRGQLTAWQRLEYLVDEGSWRPLNTLYDPMNNEEGTTGVINGLGKINGRWAVIIASDNKVLAGAWIAGQAENIVRATDLSKRLNIPLIWVLNCSGVKLTEQEAVYARRRGNGVTFFRHAELEQRGVPVLVGRVRHQPGGRRLSRHQPHGHHRP